MVPFTQQGTPQYKRKKGTRSGQNGGSIARAEVNEGNITRSYEKLKILWNGII